MSLSSLLTSKKALDTELDELFQKKPPVKLSTQLAERHGSLKRKERSKDDVDTQVSLSSKNKVVSSDSKPHKRQKKIPSSTKSSKHKPSQSSHGSAAKTVNSVKSSGDTIRGDDDDGMERLSSEDEEDEDEDDDQVELAYEASRVRAEKPPVTKEPDIDSSSAEDDEKESDTGSATGSEPSDIGHIPVHESLVEKRSSKRTSNSKASKRQFAPREETRAQRDARTLFVGNVSVEVSRNKSQLKCLHRLLISMLPPSLQPHAKVESTRFRSIPFQNPSSTEAFSDSPSKTREHDRSRTAAWRAKEEGVEDQETKKEKQYLSPAQKKKVAFIKGEFHSSTTTDAATSGSLGCNAYIVFSYTASVLEIQAKGGVHPSTIVNTIVSETQGVLNFLDRVLRLDHVAKADGQSDGPIVAKAEHDPKLSIFVGNLDFGTSEDDLRAFFESLITSELGLVSDISDGAAVVASEKRKESKRPHSNSRAQDPTIAGNDEPLLGNETKSWVTYVRIIRDKDTMMGKGFAYIGFNDTAPVDTILALDTSKLKFAKRKLRVEKCKTVPSSSIKSKLTADTRHHREASSDARRRKGPAFRSHESTVEAAELEAKAEKLKSLSKEERKALKKTDPDRIKRRLEKKSLKKTPSTFRSSSKTTLSDGKKRTTATRPSKEAVLGRKGRNDMSVKAKKAVKEAKFKDVKKGKMIKKST